MKFCRLLFWDWPAPLTLEGVPVSAGAGATRTGMATTAELLPSLTGVSAHPSGVEDFAAHSL